MPLVRRFSLSFPYLHVFFSLYSVPSNVFSALISVNVELQIHLCNYASSIKLLLHEEIILKILFSCTPCSDIEKAQLGYQTLFLRSKTVL